MSLSTTRVTTNGQTVINQKEAALAETSRNIMLSKGAKTEISNKNHLVTAPELMKLNNARVTAISVDVIRTFAQAIKRANVSSENTINYYEPHLFRICRQATVDINELKKALDADPSLVNTLFQGETPLHLLIRNSASLEAVKLLLNYGADVNITSSSPVFKLFYEGLSLNVFGEIRITCITPIEEAFVVNRDIFSLLIQTRSLKHNSTKTAVEVCLSKFTKSQSQSYELIDNCVTQLTCLDVEDLFTKSKYQYQAHLLSLRGYVAEGSLFELKILLSIVGGGDIKDIEQMISSLEGEEDRKFFNVLLTKNKELVELGKNESERYDLLDEIYRKTPRENENLENFHPIIYLPLRIRAFLRAIYSLRYKSLLPDAVDHKLFEKIILKEIFLASEAHRASIDFVLSNGSVWMKCGDDGKYAKYIEDKIKSYEKGTFELNDEIDSNIENIHCKIAALNVGDNYYVASGHEKHAIYIDFSRSAKKICIRIDNLGDGCEFHENVTELSTARIEKSKIKNTRRTIEDYVYPYALESDIGSWQQNAAKIYLFFLVIAQNRDPRSAKQWFYANHPKSEKSLPFLQKVSLDELKASYPSKRVQSVGNCVVKNNQIGLQIRALQQSPERGNYFYRLFRAVELDYLGLKNEQQLLKKLVSADREGGSIVSTNQDEIKDQNERAIVQSNSITINSILQNSLTNDEKKYIESQMQKMSDFKKINEILAESHQENSELFDPEEKFNAVVEKLRNHDITPSEFIQKYSQNNTQTKVIRKYAKSLFIVGWAATAATVVYKIMQAKGIKFNNSFGLGNSRP